MYWILGLVTIALLDVFFCIDARYLGEGPKKPFNEAVARAEEEVQNKNVLPPE